VNKKYLIIIPLSLIIALALFSGIHHNTMLVFATGSSPDSYGNMIHEVFFWTYNHTSDAWEPIYYIWTHDGGSHYFKSTWTNFTVGTYSSGFTLSVKATTEIKFGIYVLLNDTFASSSAEALSNTRVYMNISTSDNAGNWTNHLMDDNSGANTDTHDGFSCYYIYYEEIWNATAQGHPAEGETCEISYYYEAYY